MKYLVSFGIGLIALAFGLAILALIVNSVLDIPSVQERIFPAQSVAPAEPETIYPSADDIYQVEIRNGVGVSGVAERMRTYLRSKGYDVVGVGNHTSFDLEYTVIVDRVDRPEIAQQVAASLGLTPDRIRQEIRSEYHLDVSILIGKDYGLIPPFADSLNQIP